MSPSHHESHGSGYNNESWMGLGYGQHAPQHTGHGHSDSYGYDYPSSAPMPMEPSYSMTRPPPYAPPQHNQMPPPLVMPQQHIWPSMLANSNNYQQPILPAVSVQTPISATSIGSDLTPTSAKTSTSRRKLTDDERRLMCLEAENNPTMKQTQIGAKFNVERSTVSKILRQKDKYMKPQVKEEVTSPGKKTKVRLPDVEKTLANWARNQQRRGSQISTEELRKQVLMFTSGRNDQQNFTTTEWLSKFQRKYLSTRSGSREDTVESTGSNADSLDDSPISASGLVSPPISATEDIGQNIQGSSRSDDVFDFDVDVVEYEDSPTLPQGFSDVNASSEDLMSPLSPGLGRDYVSSSAIEEDFVEPGLPRQRSMTLPHIPGAVVRPTSSDRNTTPLPVRSMTTINEHKQISIDPRQTMKRHKSVPDIHDTEVVRFSTMQPPPVPRSADISPVSIPGSPSQQDETLVALHTIKRLLEQRPDVAEPDDYVMIGKLMEKLKLLRSRSPSGTPILPGGMHHINISDSPRLSKKRTVIEMST